LKTLLNLIMNYFNRSIYWVGVLSVFFSFWLSPIPSSGEIGLKPQNHPWITLFKEPQRLSLNTIDHTTWRQNVFKKETEVDSSGRFIIIREKLGREEIGLPIILPLEDYVSLRREYEAHRLWQQNIGPRLTPEGRKKIKKGGLDIDIPIPIKSKALEKVFGRTSVGLIVNGVVTIDGSYRNEQRSQVRTPLYRTSPHNFEIKQTQRFTVTGKVGDKVSVQVDQDSERPFEFENSIRLKYTGGEDEVVQSVEAGNISLSLPATRFVTFSGKNTGLFGVKANMRMGDFTLTTIASQEKSKRGKLTLKGGAQEQVTKIQDYEYRKGTYFFLNHIYRRQFPRLDQEGRHIYNPDSVITAIEVYKSGAGYDTKVGAIRGWAIARPEGANPADPDTLGPQDQEHYFGYFIRLEPLNDYFVHNELGFIALNMPLQPGEVLAVAYRDSSGGGAGDVEFQNTGSGTIILQLLWPKNPRPGDFTWDLEWKNVYYLGSKNIDKEGFELKIYFKPPSGDPQDSQIVDGQPKSYLEIFGLDQVDEGGNPQPDNRIDDNPNIINWARGELIFPDLRPFDPEGPSLLAADKRTPAIYDTTDIMYIRSQSKFYIEVKSKNKSATYSLGFNVVEGSEEVLLDGKPLQRGRDYIIDYYTGTLTILNERATRPDAQVEINYENNQLIQIDRKTLLGARGEYRFSRDSFIGGTLLYLNQSTLDRKIRVGQGPMRNLVWDINACFNFKPDFLSRAFDVLPLIRVDGPSTIKFEGEIAQVLPNPNTRNNEATGDFEGVAYIDDFEGAKKITPLGIARGSWTLSSAPVEYYPDLSRMGRLIWYNPVQQVYVKDIWPERDVNPNAPRVNVLTLEFKPNGFGEQSWGGIMKALSAGYANQTDAKFLEIWVKGDEGRIHVDLGQISEDVIPNGRLDTEDKLRYGVRNGLLDDDEDVGLDGMPGRDPTDFWDINGNGIQDPGEPTSWDDWDYRPGSSDYDHINGTEGNRNDSEGGNFPDTEDINRNGTLDVRNDYFEITFSLDKTGPDTVYIAGGKGNPKGWRLYRIPLSEAKPRGKPDWSLIEYVRVWVDGFQGEGSLSIAEINLVGNEWKERGVEYPDRYDSTDDTTVTVTVVNTHDNPEYVATISQIGVSGERDPIYGVVAKEQSLVLKVTDLAPGANGIVEKAFYEPQSYINYKKMKLFVYGKDPNGRHITPDSSQIEFSLRFGSDPKNYYEVRQLVYPGWNEVIVDLIELTTLKLDSSKVDTSGNLFKPLGGGKSYRVVGRPSLTNIRRLIAGVRNLSESDPFTGQIWMNELRLSEVKRDRGMAMRARADIKIGDLLTLGAEINRQDADFHNVNTRLGSGDNRRATSVNATLQLDKLLPSSWGISLPLSINYSEARSTPKYYPGSDIMVIGKPPEEVCSSNSQNGFSISFKKASRSKNPLIRYTLDNITANFSKTESKLSNSTTKYSNNWSYSGNITYNLRLKERPFFKPFGWMEDIPVLARLSKLKFYYAPTNFNFTLSSRESGKRSLSRSGIFSRSHIFDLTKKLSAGIRPFESLSVDFSRSETNDLRKVPKEEVFQGNFGELTGINQQISTRFNPSIFRWLKSDFSYKANFRYTNNIQQRKLGKSASTTSTISGSITLTPSMLFKRGRARRVPRARKEQKKEYSFIDDLQALTQKLSAITIRYTQSNNLRDFGLGGMPSFEYQIGRSRDPGVETIQNLGSNRSSYNRNETFSIQTGIKFTSNLSVKLKYDRSKTRNETARITGTLAESNLSLGDVNLPFFEWSVRWGGLEKLSLFKKLATSVSLTHSYSGKRTKTWNDRPDNITKESITSGFRPLVGLNIQWKKGVTTSINYNKTSTFTFLAQRGRRSGGSRKRSSNLSITTHYSKRGGLKISLPFWHKEIKNDIDFSLSFTKSTDISERSRTGEAHFVEDMRTEKTSFTPKVTYSFSRKVRGGMHFEWARIKNKITGTTTIREFGVHVTISITGG